MFFIISPCFELKNSWGERFRRHVLTLTPDTEVEFRGFVWSKAGVVTETSTNHANPKNLFISVRIFIFLTINILLCQQNVFFFFLSFMSSQFYLNSHEYYRDDYFYNWATHISVKETVQTVIIIYISLLLKLCKKKEMKEEKKV